VFRPSSVPFWTVVAALAGIGQVVLLSLTALFIYRYVKEA